MRDFAFHLAWLTLFLAGLILVVHGDQDVTKSIGGALLGMWHAEKWGRSR